MINVGNLKDKLISLPKQSGVYLFKDKNNEIIYVGKAANLKDRISSYFSSSFPSVSPKFTSLTSTIHNFEYILTDNEVEAFILENNLIKKYRPKYNIKLRDDKTYPYIKIMTNEEYPRLVITRKIKPDKAKYFGPYTSAASMRKVVKLIKQLFLIATCNKKIKVDDKNNKRRACLQYQMKNCSAPCASLIKSKEYNEQVKEVCEFLEGKYEAILKKLYKKMYEASKNLQYELAAVIRDKIKALKEVIQDQKVVFNKKINMDVIGIAKDTSLSAIGVLFIRDGKLIKSNNFLVEHRDDDEANILNSFIKDFYIKSANLPKKVILPHQIEDAQNLVNYLKEKRGIKIIKIIVSKQVRHKNLVNLATQNATHYLNTVLNEEKRRKEEKEKVLIKLKEALNLKNMPYIIEAIDISNLYGKQACGCVVVFKNGLPYKDGYRRYKIKTVSYIDDYAMIKEVINRRYKRLKDENKELPNLILIDGGKGHLNVSYEVLSSLNINNVDVAAIAKKEELIFNENNKDGIKLDKTSEALHLIQHIRDEAHRFAISYHRKLMKKRIHT